MGASSENFCLRWNDFESNVSGAFKELRAESDFFDVTLCCSDSSGRSLQAHKVILSACSTFFKAMLRQQCAQSNHPNPLIFLRGVSFNDLASVLDFMYHGEVNVAQEDLNSFLAVAEELQIKGLTNKESSSSSSGGGNAGGSSSSLGGEPSKKGGHHHHRSSSGPPAKKARSMGHGGSATSASGSSGGGGGLSASSKNNLEAGGSSSSADESKPDIIKTDPEAGPSSSSQAVTDYDGADGDGGDGYGEDYNDSYYDDNGSEMLDQDLTGEDGGDGTGKGTSRAIKALEWETSGVIRTKDGFGKCMLCCKPFATLGLAKRHWSETHVISEVLYKCFCCSKEFKNKRYRTDHMKRCHKISIKKILSEVENLCEEEEENNDDPQSQEEETAVEPASSSPQPPADDSASISVSIANAAAADDDDENASNP